MDITMSKPFSPFHLAALEAFARGGESDADIARQIGCSRALVSRWHAQYRNGATVINVDGKGAVAHESNGSHATADPVAMPADQPKGDRGLDPTPTRSLTWAERTALVVQAIVDGGVSRTAAYSIAGIPPSSGRLRFQQDETFRNAILEAEARLEMGPAKNLKELAMGKQQGAMIAAGIFLSRRFPREWQERRQLDIDVSGRIEQVNVHAILASPEAIQAASALEAALQNAEARQLPAHTDAIEGEVLSERGPDLP
jgi:hypothetical protein